MRCWVTVIRDVEPTGYDAGEYKEIHSRSLHRSASKILNFRNIHQ